MNPGSTLYTGKLGFCNAYETLIRSVMWRELCILQQPYCLFGLGRIFSSLLLLLEILKTVMDNTVEIKVYDWLKMTNANFSYKHCDNNDHCHANTWNMATFLWVCYPNQEDNNWHDNECRHNNYCFHVLDTEE